MNQYTKIILTVIAFLLCVVVGQNAFLERAEGQQSGAARVLICGFTTEYPGVYTTECLTYRELQKLVGGRGG